jgi:hypothetical protein
MGKEDHGPSVVAVSMPSPASVYVIFHVPMPSHTWLGAIESGAITVSFSALLLKLLSRYDRALLHGDAVAHWEKVRRRIVARLRVDRERAVDSITERSLVQNIAMQHTTSDEVK